MAGHVSNVAHAMTRADRIDNAVSAASELIAALIDLGPVTPQQAKLIMVAAANAAVTNIQEFEVRASAMRVAGELEREGERRGDRITG
jgi:hypothetical protein